MHSILPRQRGMKIKGGKRRAGRIYTPSTYISPGLDTHPIMPE